MYFSFLIEIFDVEKVGCRHDLLAIFTREEARYKFLSAFAFKVGFIFICSFLGHKYIMINLEFINIGIIVLRLMSINPKSS